MIEVELFKLDPFHRLEFIFQLVGAHDAPAIVQRFGQQLGRQDEVGSPEWRKV